MKEERAEPRRDVPSGLVPNAGRLIWADRGLTKGDLVTYLARVAPFMIPHLCNRPLVVTRHPSGVGGKSFYQKNAPPNTPDWVLTWPYRTRREGRVIRFILCQDARTLIWLGTQAAVEFHPWLGSLPDLSLADRAVVDLDPAPPAGFEEARFVALQARALLDALEVHGAAKTSGATGVHVVVGLRPSLPYAAVAGFARAIGELLQRAMPERVTLERRVSRRTGRVYVDHPQNRMGQTIVAPFSPRPLPGAPVSMPVSWEELETVKPSDFTVPGAADRAIRLGDRHRDVLEAPQDLRPALRRLGIPFE